MGFLSKKALFTVLFILFLGLGGAGAFWYANKPFEMPERATVEAAGDSALKAYDRAAEFYAKISADPSESMNYIIVGNEFRVISTLTKNKTWDNLALEIYERAIEATESSNALVLSNAAKIAEDIGEYKKASEYYRVAIDLTPGDAALHVSHINFMRYKLKSTETEILRAYDDAMSRVLGGADLVSSRMMYLKDIGRYEDARDDLKLLFDNKVITEDTYRSELNEIDQLESGR